MQYTDATKYYKTLLYALKYNVLTRFTEGGKRKTGKLR